MKEYLDAVLAHLSNVMATSWPTYTNTVNLQDDSTDVGTSVSRGICIMKVRIYAKIISERAFLFLFPEHKEESNPFICLVAKLIMNELFPRVSGFGAMFPPHSHEYSEWNYSMHFNENTETPEEVAERLAKRLMCYSAAMSQFIRSDSTAEIPKQMMDALHPIIKNLLEDAESRANGRLQSHPERMYYE